MQGSFSSAEQAKENSDYYDISLHMVPIWQEKGNYLYVEQALTSQPEKPYRQRVYKVYEKENGTYISAVYTIKNPENWIGKWQSPEAFISLSESDIDLKEGCEVVLQKSGNQYKGKTGIKTCSSEMRGASYATSIVTIEKNRIMSWDRGFDANDNYVWGAEKVGYIFKALK